MQKRGKWERQQTSYLMAPIVLLLEIYASTYSIIKPDKTILSFAKLREIGTKFNNNAAVCRKEEHDKGSSWLTWYRKSSNKTHPPMIPEFLIIPSFWNFLLHYSFISVNLKQSLSKIWICAVKLARYCMRYSAMDSR